MKLTIKSIEIADFKGMRKPLRIDFDNTITCIYGENHSGKTTTMDAAMWLLFGKNSQGEAQFGIDPLDELGNVIHGLENTVQGTFSVDGREVTLKRVRKEVKKRVRGEETETYRHTTAFYVDGEKMSEKEYKEFISERLISEQLFRAITNPAYFPSLKPEEQRKLLVDMVGEVTDESVTATNPKLADFLEALDGQDAEDYRRRVSYKANEIRRELETIPGRISENKAPLEALTSTLNMGFDEVRKQIADNEEETNKVAAQLADISKTVDVRSEEMMERRRELANLKAKVEEIKEETERQNINAKRAHQRDIDNFVADIDAVNRKYHNAENELNDLQRTEASLAEAKMEFRKRWGEVEAMEFTWDGSEDCPTCGQRLPQADIDQLIAKARGNFNERKQRAQDELDQQAVNIRKHDNAIAARRDEIEKRKTSLSAQLEDLKVRLKEAEGKTLKPASVEDNPDYQAALVRVHAKGAEIKSLEDNTILGSQKKERDNLNDKLGALRRGRDWLVNELAKEGQMKQYEERIAALEKQERDLNQQLADLERKEDAATEYIHAKTDLLQSRVNDLFLIVRFKMFNDLMNGNREITCECTMNGTPYSDLSNSEKLNAGLDIIRALCLHNDAYAPIWCDNAESSNMIFGTDSQQIHLIVSRDKELTIVK